MLSNVFSNRVAVDIAYQGFLLFTQGQPREDAFLSIARTGEETTSMTNYLLIALQNPCPCGYLGDKSQTYSHTLSQITRYKKKISGPLLDHIDNNLAMPAVNSETLREQETNNVEKSTIVPNVSAKTKNINV